MIPVTLILDEKPMHSFAKHLLLTMALSVVIALPDAFTQAPKTPEKELTAEQKEKIKERSKFIQEFNQQVKEKKYQEAIASYRRVVQINREVYGEKHSIFEASLIRLAQYSETFGDFDVAKSTRLELIERSAKLYGKDHSNTTDEKLDLADLELLRKLSLDERLRLLQARTKTQEGLRLHGSGKYQEAFEVFEVVLATHRQLLGVKHPTYAMSLVNLAMTYQSSQRYGEAQEHYQQALVILKESFGSNHPIYAISLNNLATVHEAQGHYAQAEVMYRQVLDIDKQRGGDQEPGFANALNNLALLYDKQGLYSQAEALYHQALAIIEKKNWV